MKNLKAIASFVIFFSTSIFFVTPTVAERSHKFCSRVYSDALEVKSCEQTVMAMSAIESGDKARLKGLLEDNLDVNEFDGSDTTLVHSVAMQRDISMLNLVNDYNADLDAQRNDGPTPFLSAVSIENNKAMIEALFNRGAKTKGVDESGNSAFDIAMRQTNKENLETLVELGIAPQRNDYPLILGTKNIIGDKNEHSCASHSIEKAGKLIKFHFGEDNRIAIDEDISVLPSVANPANRKQSFDVLQVWGSIYKGRYRMRFYYAQLGGCVLMGQEILGYASL